MKMLPIKFQQEYGNTTQRENVYEGFEPFTDDFGYHETRIIEIEPGFWNQGSRVIVRILDKVFPGGFTKEIHNVCIYDNGGEFAKEFLPSPNAEQRDLMTALATGDLRGKFAEDIAHGLMIGLCIMNPKFGMDKFLPEVVAYWKKHYEKYNCKIKSS